MISYRSQPFVPRPGGDPSDRAEPDRYEVAKSLADTVSPRTGLARSIPRRKPGSRRRDPRKGLIGRPMGEVTARVQVAVLEFEGRRLTTRAISDLTRLARDHDLYRACDYMCHLKVLRRIGKGVFVKMVKL